MDFIQTMKHWRRMCKAQDDSTCGACEGCPLMDNGVSCIAVYEDDFDKIDFAHVEKTVTKWAQENPEPVYPTWREYIENLTGILMIDVIDDPIPADIAQKLGIEPLPKA